MCIRDRSELADDVALAVALMFDARQQKAERDDLMLDRFRKRFRVAIGGQDRGIGAGFEVDDEKM